MNSLIALRPVVNIGDTFGRLTVIGVPFFMRTGKTKRAQWCVCQCECGNIMVARCRGLSCGDAKSCGCAQYTRSKRPVVAVKPLVEIGQTFGRLTVVGLPFNAMLLHNGKRSQHCVCDCDCGARIIAECAKLKIGNTRSCGCLQKRSVTEKNYKHGLAGRNSKKTSPYWTWCHMRERCFDPRNKMFHRYGGRGITICEEWKDDPEAFCEWANQNGWDASLTIDRIDNDGNYEPSNCRFVTQAENNRNR